MGYANALFKIVKAIFGFDEIFFIAVIHFIGPAGIIGESRQALGNESPSPHLKQKQLCCTVPRNLNKKAVSASGLEGRETAEYIRVWKYYSKQANKNIQRNAHRCVFCLKSRAFKNR